MMELAGPDPQQRAQLLNMISQLYTFCEVAGSAGSSAAQLQLQPVKPVIQLTAEVMLQCAAQELKLISALMRDVDVLLHSDKVLRPDRLAQLLAEPQHQLLLQLFSTREGMDLRKLMRKKAALPERAQVRGATSCWPLCCSVHDVYQRPWCRWLHHGLCLMP
jgi:hypothetical protein